MERVGNLVSSTSSEGRPLTAHQRVGLRLVAGIVLILVVMLLVDDPVARWVRDHRPTPMLKPLLELARTPGNFAATVGCACVILAIRPDAIRRVGLVLLVGGAASVAAIAVKLACGRPRPMRGDGAFDWWHPLVDATAAGSVPNFSFPSADAALAFATAVMLSRLAPRGRVFFVGWAALVCVARVFQLAHFPSDVVAGALLGAGIATWWPAGGMERPDDCWPDVSHSREGSPSLAKSVRRQIDRLR